jgi:aspartyl-tRNA(Asn)/glutamyl-tRNA(Gln) amidotransferase subunit B
MNNLIDHEGYKLVIGLEIHIELNTDSKMFCRCSADYFSKEPNTQTCPVCLGFPGSLPVPNKKAIEDTMLIGKALGCSVQNNFKFDRKHYFYPDLPKGYQISQFDKPINKNGLLEFFVKNKNGTFTKKQVKISRVHLEEDTGKLTHRNNETLIDFNRAGVPLVEIVTEPDFDCVDTAKAFLEEVQLIIRYLGVSSADMEKGSMRLEPNISVKKPGQKELPPYKVELKNINSFRFVQKAIEFEVQRQVEILQKGQTPPQETRGFNEKDSITYTQRSKEDAEGYRYFPEPDIPPFELQDEYIEQVVKNIPELPSDKMERFINTYSVKPQDAFVLTRSIGLADYFEEIVNTKNKTDKTITSQQLANLLINKKIDPSVDASEFVKQVQLKLKSVDIDEELVDRVVEKVISGNPKPVSEYLNGKENVLMFLVGCVMKELKGKASADLVKNRLLSRMQKTNE